MVRACSVNEERTINHPHPPSGGGSPSCPPTGAIFKVFLRQMVKGKIKSDGLAVGMAIAVRIMTKDVIYVNEDDFTVTLTLRGLRVSYLYPTAENGRIYERRSQPKTSGMLQEVYELKGLKPKDLSVEIKFKIYPVKFAEVCKTDKLKLNSKFQHKPNKFKHQRWEFIRNCKANIFNDNQGPCNVNP